jgi:hypothetical protein
LPTPPLAEVLFEMTRVGDYIRVSAIDPRSGIEAVTFGPARATPFSLQQAARRKLEYLLAGGVPQSAGPAAGDTPPDEPAKPAEPAPIVPPLDVPGNRARGVRADPQNFTPYGPPRGRR